MMFAVIASVLLLIIHQGECGMNATVQLHPHESPLNIGNLTFTQDSADSPVRITGTILGLNASSAHGFHIHVDPVAENSPNCTSAGPHFNPYSAPHGLPSASITQRHVGDLGNITVDADGSLELNMTDSIIQLFNLTQSIVNRTVVIHLLRDDGGEGGFNDSTTTGNAGARIICGLIKLSHEDPITTTSESTTLSTGSPTSSATTVNGSTTTPISTTTPPSPSPTTVNGSSTTHIPTTPTPPATTTVTTAATTKAAGLNIQPAMFILILTAITGYIIHY